MVLSGGAFVVVVLVVVSGAGVVVVVVAVVSDAGDDRFESPHPGSARPRSTAASVQDVLPTVPTLVPEDAR